MFCLLHNFGSFDFFYPALHIINYTLILKHAFSNEQKKLDFSPAGYMLELYIRLQTKIKNDTEKENKRKIQNERRTNKRILVKTEKKYTRGNRLRQIEGPARRLFFCLFSSHNCNAFRIRARSALLLFHDFSRLKS